MQLHASCVALKNQGVLIIGPPGSGKSSLALDLMSFGAMLIADDSVQISLSNGWPTATGPETIRGVIEARGIGLLACDTIGAARLYTVIDMGQVETDRLPPDRTFDLKGVAVPLLHKVESPHFAAAIRQYLLGGKAVR